MNALGEFIGDGFNLKFPNSQAANMLITKTYRYGWDFKLDKAQPPRR